MEQGQIGDCYFAASMAEVAHQHPELIENMFKQNDDGTITVTFKERDWNGNVTDVPVKIDGDLPLAWGGLRYAHGRGASDAALTTRYKVDPIMGGTGMNVNFVRVEPVGGAA